MKITENDVKVVASLSRLKISDEESAEVIAQLDKILTYVENPSTLPKLSRRLTHCQCKIFSAKIKSSRHLNASLLFQMRPSKMTATSKFRVFSKNRRQIF